MALSYTYKINPCVFFWLKNFFSFYQICSKSDCAKTEECIQIALPILVLPGGTISVVLKELFYLKSQG